MKISTGYPNKPMTVVPKSVLTNRNLSVIAKGLYCCMYSALPEGDFSIGQLSQYCKITIGQLMDALEELRTENYIGIVGDCITFIPGL